MRTQEYLNNQLNHQVYFLTSSAEAFDRGILHEAKRMAVAIRILVHDAGRSVSLLAQTGKLHTMGFLDSPNDDYNTRNLITYNSLFLFRLYNAAQADGSYGEIRPILDQGKSDRFLNFPDWWNKIVYTNTAHVPFTRSQLVLTVAEKEGGAHIDPDPDDKLAGVSSGETFGWKETRGELSYPVENADLIMVRQIAYEILYSLQVDRLPNDTHKEYIPTYDKLRQTKALIKKGLDRPSMKQPVNKAIRQGYSEAVLILEEHKRSYAGIDDLPFRQCKEIAKRTVDYLNGECTQDTLLSMMPS